MIRQPVVSGRFYPSAPEALRSDVHGYLEASRPPSAAMAVMAPHAGYMYSGSVAGSVYASVELPARFILLGPNHTGRGAPVALYPEGAWLTPLGSVSIDRELNSRLIRECSLVREDAKAHSSEHSLEVHLPFLQARMEDFTFSALCVGASDYAILEELGHALARVVAASKVPPMMIVSSDMSHFESSGVAARKDRMAMERIEALDPEGLSRVVRDNRITMCGISPAVSALVACRDLGATRGELIRYAHSGEVSGDYSQVVGYAGMAIS